VNRRALRFGFVALLAGGLVWWAQLRSPRDLRIDVDLTAAMPGDVVEAEVIVRREGRALARVEEQYGETGAPARLSVPVRARPGPVDVEVTLVAAHGAARRVRKAVTLTRDGPAVVRVEP
jgi:hypothetical protein